MPTRRHLARPASVLLLVVLLAALSAATGRASSATAGPRAPAGPGGAWGWGANSYGQLGDGSISFEPTSSPMQMVGLNAGVIAVAAGDAHSLMLKSDGTVWAAGLNLDGQLGTGNTANSDVPVQVSGLSGVIGIAAGTGFSLALKADGTVWAWGNNSFGQLGNGTTAETHVPVQVSGLNGVKAISAGSNHSLALKMDGTVWAWGWNMYGQLGTGTTSDSSVPVQVSSLGGVWAVAGGNHHSVAITQGGLIWAWGDNSSGQLGDGTTTERDVPVQVAGLGLASSVTAGDSHTLALTPPPPAAPTHLTLVSETPSSVAISWTDNATNETGYVVERNTSGGEYAQLGSTLPANTTTYTDATASPDTQYCYRVKAVNAAGSSLYSNELCVTMPPSAPTNLAIVSVTTTSIYLTWADNATTETGYVVQRQTDGGAFTQVGSTLPNNTKSFTDRTIAIDTSYCYRVAAVNAGGTSDYSNVACTATVPAQPTNLVITAVTYNSYSLAWKDNSSVETGYVVERRIGSGPFAQVGNTLPANTTTYVDPTTTPEAVYCYRVKAINASGSSAYSSQACAATPPAAPTNLAVTVNSAPLSATLTWTDNAQTETGYVVERQTNGGPFSQLGGTLRANTTSTTDTSIVASTTYCYRVKATNTSGSSAYSNTACTSGAPSAPTGLAVTSVSASGVTLGWTDTASNETGYVVEREVSGGSYAQLGGTLSANTTTYTDASAATDTTYCYRVKAVNSAGSSGYSNEACTLTVPAAPSGLAASSVSTTSVTLSWTDNSTTATGYVVERQTGTGSFAQVGPTLPGNSTSFTDTTVAANTTYGYRVKAVNASGSSAYSATVQVTTPKPPYNRTENTAPGIQYTGTWFVVPSSLASGGSLSVSAVPQSQASFTWTGTDVKLVLARGTALGAVKVQIEGATVATIDLYSSANLFQQQVYIKENLAPGTHTVTITVTGLKNPASTAIAVPLDAILSR